VREPRVGEGLLDEVLAVVELAVHRKGQDVLPDRVELLFLHPADLVARVDNIDADPLDAPEGLAHGAARVARGGDKHVETLPAVAQAAHEPRHHARGEVLEGGRGAPVEAHDADPVMDRLEGDVEGIGVFHDLPDDLPRQLVPQKGLGHETGRFRVGLAPARQDVPDVERRDGVGHEETLVGCLPLDQGLAERDLPLERREAGHPLEAAVRAVVADFRHALTSLRAVPGGRPG